MDRENHSDIIPRRMISTLIASFLSALLLFINRPLTTQKHPSIDVSHVSAASDTRNQSLSPARLTFSPMPVKGCISETETYSLLRSLRPDFDRRRTQGRIPVSLILHALHLWGDLENRSLYDSSSFHHRKTALTQEDMITILLDQREFEKKSSIRGSVMLRRSDYGIEVATAANFDYGSEETSTHPGALLSALADASVPLTRKVHTYDGFEGTVSDIVIDEAARVTWGAELEWIAISLSRYSSLKEWKNRFGEKVSFDWIADRLVSQIPGTGACNGTHVPAALVTLYLVDGQDGTILSDSIKRKIRKRMHEYLSALISNQTKDGNWTWEWAAEMHDGRVPVRNPGYSNDLIAVHPDLA